MRAVIALGGSVVADAVEKLDEYVAVLQELADDLDTLMIVTGAGPLKRYQHALNTFDVPEAELDLVGIQATRLHAAMLAAAMDANIGIPETLEDAVEQTNAYDVVVLGGLVPGQSTDAVAAQCADLVGADRLVLATTVDGVYDRDPAEHEDADKYHSLSPDDLVAVVRDYESTAGSHPLIDLVAAKLIRRADLETVVLDGRDSDEIGLCLTDDHHGTTITE